MKEKTEIAKFCGCCKYWHDHDMGFEDGMCENEKSAHKGDFRDFAQTCEFWEVTDI